MSVATRLDCRTTLDQIAHRFGVTHDDLVGSRRPAQLCRARHAAAWLLQRRHQLSSAEAGRLLGDRDHTTILHSVRCAEQLRDRDPEFRSVTDALLARTRRTDA